MSELKPCPFCGKENTVAGSTERMILGWWYACEDCFENRKGGVHEDRWNTRPIEDALRKRIAELEAAQRWIPVSERLPQIGVRVLFYNSFTKNIHKGWYSGDEWTSEIGVFYNGDKLKRITHWMPLPESPNDTQTDTFVYGKDSTPIPCPFCGEIMRSVRDE